MKILLTGACGLVGRTIMSVAGERAHEFVPMDLCADVEKLSRGIRANVRDREAMLAAARGCDAIIHTAAMHGAFKGKASNQEFINANLVAAENVFESAIQNGVKRVVMSSTLEVLCGGDWIASGRTVLDESMPPRPDWIYPMTKLMAEQLGHYHVEQSGLEVVQLRYAWVLNETNASRGLILLARGVADTDVADANLLSVTTPGLRDHVFLIGPDVPFKQSDIQLAQVDPAAVLERHWPGSVAVLGERARRLKDEYFWPVCRIDRAKQILGWQPKVTFERFIRGLGWRAPNEATTNV